MTRRLWLLFILPAARASASFFSWRAHRWATVNCQNGPVLSLWIRGELDKLTEKEREFLNAAAAEMANLEGTPAVRHKFGKP